MIINKLTNYA